MNEYTFDKISVGQTESFAKTITKEMEDAFREITGDINPLHQNDKFAKEASGGRYQSHIAFGMLTASLISTLAGVYLPGKYSLIHSIEKLYFKKPVFISDELIVTGKVVDKQEDLKLIIVVIKITNQTGKTVAIAQMKNLVQQ